MSDFIVDKDGKLKITVTRWCQAPPPEGWEKKEVHLCAQFEPGESVEVEIDGEQVGVVKED